MRICTSCQGDLEKHATVDAFLFSPHSGQLQTEPKAGEEEGRWWWGLLLVKQ